MGFRSGLAALACALSFVGVTTQAATTEEINRGLTWLQGQVASDGSIASEAASIALPSQVQPEVAATLATLIGPNAVPSALVARLNAQAPENSTEVLARRLLGLRYAGVDAASIRTVLADRQNQDGGYGPVDGFQSHPADSVLSLQALAASGAFNRSAEAYAFVYANQQADGGLRGDSLAVRVSHTAMAVLSLQYAAGDLRSLNATRGMLTWLLSTQQVDGSWSSSTHLTAQALNALTLFGSDVTARVNARAYLLARQGADGSWSGDPFMTAVALRALAADPMSAPTTPAPNPDPGQPPAPQQPTAPSPSSISGLALNPATGSPLPGVQVVLAGASSGTQVTAANGSFSFPSLAAGDYAVTLTKDGFNSASRSFSVGLGQVIDLGAISLTQMATTGVIKGRVTTAANGQPFAGVTITVSGSMNATRTTDAQGAYEFASVPPGVVSISAGRSGYTTVAGTASLAAGESLTFSPALVATTEPQPTGSGRFKGNIAAAGSNAPLAGVIVMLNGTQAGVSNATGDFDITLAPGAYSLRLVQPGYDVATGSFVITAATVTNAGNIRLTAQLQSTTIRGRVTDTASGRAVAGALVEVVGGVSVKAAADGSYMLADLSGTAFDLRASAQGYLTQAWKIQTERPAAIAQSFALTALPSAAADLENLVLAPASVGAAEAVTLTANLVNTGNTSQNVVVSSQIVDASGKVIATGGAFDTDGVSPLGNVTLGAGVRQPIIIKWNSGLFAPGSYQIQGLVVQAGTMTREAPAGRVLATRGQALTITSKSKISGAASAQPAVMRAGLGTSTQLSALLQNTGNVALSARTYRLDVIDEKTATRVARLEAQGPVLAVSELQKISFGTWTPTAASNFKIVVSAPDAPDDGQVLGKVYVGDAATATYTVNKSVVGAGDQTVRGKVSVSGQDIANGTISDPLAEPIKNAIQRSVAYNDLQASTWVRNNQCLGCHVVTQALVGGELTRRLTAPNEKQRTALFNALSTYRQSNGAVYSSHPEFQRVQTTLGAWALNSWHAKDEFAAALSAVADNLASTQQSNGQWSPDYTDVYMWRSPIFSTAFNIKSLSEVVDVLGRVPRLTTYDSAAWLRGNGMNGNYNLVADPAGRVIVANYFAGTVQAIASDGTSQTLMSGLTYPQGLALATDGTLFVGTGPAIMKRSPDGTVSTYASVNDTTGIAIAPNGDLFTTNYNTPTIRRITPAGSVSNFFTGAPLNGPYGIQADADGSVIVLSYNSKEAHRLRADGTYETLTSWINGNPRNIQRWRDGWLIGTSTGAFYYNARWEGDRVGFNAAHGIAVMPDGSVVTGDGGSTLLRLLPRTVDGPARISAYTNAISKAANWLLNDSVHNDWHYTLQIAHRLIGLANAKRILPAGSAQAAAIQAKMDECAAWLRSRQNADGGWGQYPYSNVVSDSMVTAQVGFALDYMHPSPSDPVVQNAARFLLSRQQADGSWLSENNIFGTRLAATTWVEIWLPVALDRIGGIDTDLKLTFASNVGMSNPTIPPATTVFNGDGSTSHTWRMVGVTAAGRDVQFDLGLPNMQLGESRPASLDASLTFRNSEGGDPVVAPITIPAITASAYLGHTAGTDKQAYTANTAVTLNSQISNLGVSATTAAVEFRVLSADGTVLVTLPRAAVASMAAGGTGTASAAWNTGTNYAGTYRVEARLFDAGDRFVATAQASFTIQASETPGTPSLSAALQLDKGTYSPGDTVRLVDRVSNLAANQSWQNLSLRTVVLNPDGSTRWSATATLDEVAANGLREQSYGVALSNAPAGSYQVRLTVLDASGAVQAQAAKTFTVSSTAATGVGISGHLSVAPKPVFQGGSVSVAFDVLNQGNAALAGLPLTINIVNPGTTQLLASLPVTVQNLATQASFAGSVGWTANVAPGTQLVAVLAAQVGGRSLTLAQDNLTVTTPPVTASVAAQREARVLALVSCPPGSDGGAATQPVSGGEANCAVRRGAALAQAMTNLGLVNKVVTTRAEFETELRCGIYNTYWISGGSNKLSDDVAKEVIEAIRRGDSLIVEGTQDGRNQLLYPVAGVQLNGSLGQVDPGVTFPGSAEFPAGSLATLGRPGRFTPVGAQLQASFASDAAALTTASFGQGRSTMVAFELARMLEQNDTARQALLDRVLQVARTSSEIVANGAPVALAIQVSNAAAQAATAQVQATVPAELQLLPGQATSWNLSLAAGQSQTLVLRVKPLQPGDWTVDVTATSGGQVNTAHYNVQAQAPEALAGHAVALAQALGVNGDADTAAKSQAVQALTQAQTLGAEQRHDEALSLWLQASSALQTIQSADTRAASLATAQAVQGTERALCPQLACLSGAIQIRQGATVPNPLPINANANVQRQVANSCPVALPSWHIGVQLRNRRTAQTLLQLDDELGLGAGQGNTAQGNFLASAGDGLAGDTLEALLVGQRLGWQHHLGRATVPLAGALMCDVDGNGAINTLDIQLIMQSIGKTVAAGDPRDPDGDKIIKINDSRACTARCTKPNCAQ